ncbi:HAD family hydrolase [Bacteroides gallinaceum]|uniref:D-glycero-alpha-D-manno-heptose-1,7-bisphosphate 7-phosphatase n=1 Tax=Bacteroides gallinaceum TaxID=1462571 RepID=UPI0025AA3F13|nr:HAD family hydrolase [Bacteroides gallinaceum]MDN0080643.1 HAD family hydrolase [Bacteroides gallinaceum]
MNLKDIDISGYDTLLLDRDGVINRLRPNDYVKCWDEFEFLPGVLETLSKWNKQVKRIFIVTNQRGVGKGLMTENDLSDIHKRMCDEIAHHGGHIDKVYYCTALTEEDSRRKPGTGMFKEILYEYPDIRPSDCLMIGDSDSDMKFAENCGIKGIKVQ